MDRLEAIQEVCMTEAKLARLAGRLLHEKSPILKLCGMIDITIATKIAYQAERVSSKSYRGLPLWDEILTEFDERQKDLSAKPDLF